MPVVFMMTQEDRERLEDAIKNAGFDIINSERHKLDQLFLYVKKHQEVPE